MIYQDFVLSLQCHYKIKRGLPLPTVLLVIICASCQSKKKTESEKNVSNHLEQKLLTNNKNNYSTKNKN